MLLSSINSSRRSIVDMKLMHQSIPPAPSSPPPPHTHTPPGYCGAFARLVSAGGGAFANFALPGGHSWAFDTHAVSYQKITTQRVLLENKQIGSSVKDRTKLKRVVKACSRFYACISSLLIEPKLHSEIGAIDVNQRFLVIESNFCWYYLKNILSYYFIKLFITYNLTALY